MDERYAKALKEWEEAVTTATDAELVECGIGCNNSTLEIPFGMARCKYNNGGRCSKGAMLTSTLSGAHPNDCPIRMNQVKEK